MTALALVALRLLGLFLAAPLFGSRLVPLPLRLGLAGAVALVILPLVPLPEGGLPEGAGALAGAAAAELATGAGLGFAASLLIAAFQLAGQHIAIQMGMGLDGVLDPSSGAEVPALAQFHGLLALLAYLGAGAHRGLLAAAARSFALLPLGGFQGGEALAERISGAFGGMLALSLSIAAPVLAALLLSTLVLAFLSRVLPQMNLWLLAFPLQAGLGLGALVWTLPAMMRGALGVMARG